MLYDLKSLGYLLVFPLNTFKEVIYESRRTIDTSP